MSEQRARLFVALELPESARKALVEWCSSAIGDPSGLRPIAAGNLHVTLCFLGWHSVAEIEAIGAACAATAIDSIPSLTLGGPLWLPARRPRVLAVEIEDSQGALGRTQAALADSLRAGRWYAVERRAFLAHVTVARVGQRGGTRSVDAPPSVRFGASTLTLYRSHLGPAGARYEPLHRFELGSGAAVRGARGLGRGPYQQRTGVEDGPLATRRHGPYDLRDAVGRVDDVAVDPAALA